MQHNPHTLTPIAGKNGKIMKRKKQAVAPEYPKTLETFNPPTIGIGGLHQQGEPSSVNGWVRVRRYKVTIEEIDEPIEVIQQRIQALWDKCDNMHNWTPLQNAAEKYGYTLQGKIGGKK